MQGETSSVLGPPSDAGARRPSYDPDWYEKIERAKQAREIGEKLQKTRKPVRGYHSSRYERQALISQYQEQYNCNLVILSDFFLQADSVPFVEETLSDADPSREPSPEADTG